MGLRDASASKNDKYEVWSSDQQMIIKWSIEAKSSSDH